MRDADRQQSPYPIELGAKIPLALDSPCERYEGNLRCNLTDGYIEINPFGSSFHYKLSCNNGHYVRNVPRAEVELRLGIQHAVPSRRSGHPLDPPRRIGLNVKMRDRMTCVYCGQRAGDEGLDGKQIVVDVDHIIPKDLIDYDDIRLDRELTIFARDVQLVTSCRSCNAAKGKTLIPIDEVTELFVRHVLKGKTGGTNVGLVSTVQRLHRIAAKRSRPTSA